MPRAKLPHGPDWMGYWLTVTLWVLVVLTIMLAVLTATTEPAGASQSLHEGSRMSATWYKWSSAPVPNYAAHKSLKLGTTVVLCHHRHCSTVIVVDRCPTCGRGFDVSPRSFVRLGVPLEQGVVKVYIKRLIRQKG